MAAIACGSRLRRGHARSLELGVSLLERSSRGVAVTAAGEALAAGARTAIEAFDAALAAARGQTGRLRVGFEAAGAGRLSTQSRARFLARFPHVRVEPRRYDWWAVNPRPDGRSPTWGPENDNVEEMLEQVADGSAYCIVPASMTEYYARPDLVWVHLDDVDPLRIALAWRERDASPLVAAYAAIVRELA
jgi:DNA-binding transcriptional LysR family regulator